MKEYCVIIPAIKKNAKIPDQLVKKLRGITLIQRAIDTACGFTEKADIFVITDSQEISLICQRNGVGYEYNKELKVDPRYILRDLKDSIDKKAAVYRNIILFRASTPLIRARDIRKALDKFLAKGADVLVTLKKENHRLWKQEGDRSLESLLFDEQQEQIYIESRAFIFIRSEYFLAGRSKPEVIAEYLNDRAIEINSYQNWWICEKLLARKRIVFVVMGYAEVGMGHVYRALTLAHEIDDHEILFLCTENSEMAVKNIAERDYKTVLQQNDLLSDVLALNPDLVINDILTTDENYVKALRDQGIKVVNFEDLGEGAVWTDLTFNELFDQALFEGENICWGHDYYFLRDEFSGARIHSHRESVNTVLITFGGTDPGNYTQKVLALIKDFCRENGIRISVVVGPGYKHKTALLAYIEQLPGQEIAFTDSTSVMSSIMEQADIAISSNGRTVYELAHMNIPAVVLSQNERELTHCFASEENGFANIGTFAGNHMEERITSAFTKLVKDATFRKQCQEKMKQHDFIQNKQKVARMIGALLESL